MAPYPLLSTEMAHISFSAAGKELGEAVRFVFGNSNFELDKDGSVDTDNPEIIAGATTHPYLEVEQDQAEEKGQTPEEQAKAAAESTDPHVNPRADHLSPVADPEVVKAAQEKNAAIQAANQPNVPEQQAQDAEVQEPTPPQTASAAPTPIQEPAETHETSTPEHTD